MCSELSAMWTYVLLALANLSYCNEGNSNLKVT